ncbi:MAG: DUF1552 domain-containing protein [Lentisphaeraceae bacterium]|nr:DUF1552 domain-containing protein [Lentisphaeraceae bacterium]
MAYFSFNKSLDRRYFLKGTGASLALPFLSAMVPAFGSGKKDPAPRRFMAVNAGLGYHTEYFFPETPGKDYKLSPYMERLKDHKSQLTLISGVSHPEQNGNNGHASATTLLTSARRPGLAGFKNTISIDQLIAAQLGAVTRFPYIATGTSSNTLAWTANGVPIPGDRSPSELYKKLFIAGKDWEVKFRIKQIERNKSILDALMEPAAKLDKKLGGKDKEKLDEYLTSVRELEIRLKQNKEWANKPKPKVELDVKEKVDKIDVKETLDMYYHLLALAIQTDSSRSITFNIGGSGQVPNIKGVTMDWHNLSHHGKDKSKIKELALIENVVIDCFNTFLDRLKSTKEGDKTLLDSTAVVYTSNLGNASSHNWRNLPLLVAGGNFKHGSYVAHDPKNNERLANLLCQMGNYMGLGIDHFGSSDSPTLKGLES